MTISDAFFCLSLLDVVHYVQQTNAHICSPSPLNPRVKPPDGGPRQQGHRQGHETELETTGDVPGKQCCATMV